MTLQKKTILIVGATIFILLSTLLISFYFIIRSDFYRIEEQSARLAINEAFVAFNNDLYDLSDLTGQLATENDTKALVQSPNSAQLKKIFTDVVSKRQKISFALLINKKGQIIYGTGYDHFKKTQMPLPPSLMEIITPQSILLKHSNAKSSLSGVLALQEKPLFIAARPVSETKSPDRINGTIILAQWLDFSDASHLSHLSRTSVSILLVGKQNTPADLRRIVESISDDNPIAVTSDYKEIGSYKLVNDIFGLPAFLIKAGQPRLINKQNKIMFSFLFFILVIIIAAVCALIFYFLMDRMVLNRLSHISKQIRSIAASGNYKGRLSIDSKDELTAMGYSINFLLIKLDQTEKALHNMSRLHKNITANMFDVIIQTDLQGTYQYVSPSHETVLGHNEGKLLGKSFFDLIHPKDVKNVYELFHEHITKRTPIKFECRAHHSAGYYIWLEVMANPLFDDEANITGSVIVARDMTLSKKDQRQIQTVASSVEEKIAGHNEELVTANKALAAEIAHRAEIEKAIQRSRNMLRAVFDGISEPLIMIGGKTNILMANEAALQYFAVKSYQEIIGAPCQSTFGRKDTAEKESEKICQAVAKKEQISLELEKKSPSWQYEKVFIYPLDQKNVDDGEAIIRISDITQSKLMEKQLLHGEKLATLGLLISGIAHEINNPNNFIVFNLPILNDYLNEIIPIVDSHAENHPHYELFGMTYSEFREDIFKLLKNIRHGAERINSTVAKLREFSRKKDTNEQCLTNPAEIIQKAVSICQIQINKTVKNFIVNVDSDLPTIYTDPDGLQQVFINLLINATQAMDKHDSLLKIHAYKTDDWRERIIIDIEDNGCGMEDNTLANLFTPFFTTKPQDTGTGLGLYISRNIVESLGGRIEVESKPGQGTKIKIIIAEIQPVHRQNIQG
jgi:PAS domain S-box-containing protein